eukprot:TRINITY_DN44121_c0_g1_i1.p1 TRINITY_DN44121_c0_g1~~TRINITY_DN44121_c0_g1_i1.p1  ORF type:complete len:397 (+),score=68.78 TRINITY_DN44121_c0_g1_i1:148-1338(+)
MLDRSSIEASLEKELCDLVKIHRPSAGEQDQHRQCLQNLQQIVQRMSSKWAIQPFGSSVNGFGMAGSDLDVTFVGADDAEHQRFNAIHELRNNLVPLLQNDPQFEVVEAVWTARVPILKLKFQGHLEVDISCQNMEAILNTELLLAYAKLHPVVRDLVMVVKLWAKDLGIVGAAKRHLSSYSLTLMVIYFLQVQSDFEFPRLSTDFFSSGGQASMLGELQWTCPMTLSGLVARFFMFFSSEFFWGSEVVSVRSGRRGQRGDPEFMYLAGQTQWRLHVEDPFLLSRNLNCVLGLGEEKQLRDSFDAGASAMSVCRMPGNLRHFLEMSPQSDRSPFITQKVQPDLEDASTGFPSSAAGLSDDEGETAMQDTSVLLARLAAPAPEAVPAPFLPGFKFWL